MTHPPHSHKERPFLPRMNAGGILGRLGEVYNLVAPEADEYVCWIEGRTLRGGVWSGDIGSVQEWKQFIEKTYKSSYAN